MDHLSRDCHTDCISYSLAKGSRSRLHSRNFSKFGMTGSLTVEAAKIPYLLHRQIESAQVEPCVEEHASVPSGEDKAVAVDPGRSPRIEGKGVTKKNSANLSRSERQPDVTALTSMNCVDGEPSCLIGSFT